LRPALNQPQAPFSWLDLQLDEDPMSQCATCHAGCCRSFAVPVTGADILRLATRRGLDFWDFVVRWADPQGMIAQNHAPHFRFIDDLRTPYVICLMPLESSQFPGTTKCLFLREGEATPDAPLGISQCGAYEDRPAACRAFPAKLNETGELAILYDVPSRGRRSDHPAYELCARQWLPEDLDPIQQVQDLVVAKYEMNFFFKLAESWNESPGHWREFPEFLQLVYAARLRPVGEAETVDRIIEDQ
jgi:Fe-S-cluster containining protein